MKNDIFNLEAFLQPGPLGEIGEFADFVGSLPSTVEAIRDAIGNLFIHQMWLEEYGILEHPRHAEERNFRCVREYLRAAIDLTGKDLNQKRHKEEKISCICRDFSLIFTAFLRHQGIPARSRCGYASYFHPGKYTDHWITEYWDSVALQWKQADAQLDEFQCKALNLSFDPLMLPLGAFLTASEVWKEIESGNIDPENCGILEYWGKHFVFGSMVQDHISVYLNLELKPWDLRILCNDIYSHEESGNHAFKEVLQAMVLR